MKNRLKFRNKEILESIIDRKSSWSSKTTSAMIEILEFLEKKEISVMLFNYIDNGGEVNLSIANFCKHIKISKPFKTTKTNFLFISEFKNKTEIYVDTSKFVTSNGIIEDQIKKDITNFIKKIEEELKLKNILKIKIFVKEQINNFQFEISIPEILNKNLTLIEKISIIWESPMISDLRSTDVREELMYLMSNKKTFFYSHNLLVECVESIYKKKLENILIDLLEENKEETDERIVGLMLKKVKKTLDVAFTCKEIMGEITVYSYSEKKDIFVDFRKSFCIQNTVKKIIKIIEKLLEDFEECSLNFRTKDKKSSTKIALRGGEASLDSINKAIAGELGLPNFTKIEIKGLTKRNSK